MVNHPFLLAIEKPWQTVSHHQRVTSSLRRILPTFSDAKKKQGLKTWPRRSPENIRRVSEFIEVETRKDGDLESKIKK